MAMVNCSNTEDLTGYPSLDFVTSDLRYALVTGTITSESGSRVRQLQAEPDTPSLHYDVQLSAAVICKFDYAVSRANVTHDLVTDSFQIGPLSQPRYLDNLTGYALGEFVHSALELSESLRFTGPDDAWADSLAPTAESTLFYVMARMGGADHSLRRLLSPEALRDAAVATYSGLAAYFMRESCLPESYTSSLASVVYTEDRVRVGLLSAIVMAAGFIVLVFCTTWIMLTVSRTTAPRKPDTIVTQAMVLRSSSGFREILRNASGFRTTHLSAVLGGFLFNSTAGGFKIQTTYNEFVSVQLPRTKPNAWVPLAARQYMVCLTFLTPLFAIVLLEVLYRISQANKGIFNVGSDENTVIVFSRYLTALIMLLIATCFNGFDFLVSSFAPFSLLRKGGVPATRSIRLNLLDNIPPTAVIRSLKARHSASIFSNLAGMTGSVLTIVASGLLFLDRNVVHEEAVLAYPTTRWNIDWKDPLVVGNGGAGDGGACVELDKVQKGLAIMPSMTWNDTAFPHIGNIQPLSSSSSIPTSESRNYTFQLDALRPELSCEVVMDENISIARHGPYGMEFGATHPLPQGCHRGGQYGTEAYANFSVGLRNKVPHGGWFLDLHMGPWPSEWEESFERPGWASVGEYEETYNFSIVADNPPGCPSIVVLVVKHSELDTRPEDITALVCSQKLWAVPLIVTYNGSDLAKPVVSTDIPPVMLDDHGMYLTNGTEGIDTFPWRVQTCLASRSSIGTLTTFRGREGLARPFFQNMMYGPNGTALNDLLGSANREVLIGAVQRLYNRYMSLVIDMKFREHIPEGRNVADRSDPARGAAIQGTMSYQTTRMKVHGTSKLALQIMLGTMTLLGLAAFLSTDLRGTLPRNPCSMASTMGFLVCSDLCDGPDPLIPENALFMNKSEQNELFSGWLFSLGWWSMKKNIDSEEESAERSFGDKDGAEHRFGIDVGDPEQLGFRDTKLFELRRRFAPVVVQEPRA